MTNTRSTKIVCTDISLTIFLDFCTAFVCVREIFKNKLENFDCMQKKEMVVRSIGASV
jgi:hypothetical protein